MRTAVHIADLLSWLPLLWYALGTAISRIFPRFSEKVLQEYRDGRYERR